MRIFVENLAPETSRISLCQIFSLHGKIDSCKLSVDKGATSHKGTAYVEMPNEEEARAAIESLNHTHLHENKLRITEAGPESDESGSENSVG